MRNFNWDDLRCFLAVASRGSTLGAARALKLHQTTVARRVDALEQAIGLGLFERSATGYTLSSAGNDLLPLAREMEAAATAFAERAESHRRRQKQIVRITTSDVLANLVITPALPGFAASHPDIQVHTIIDDRKLDLTKGEADLALRVGAPAEGGELIVRKLAEAAWGIYCSKAYATAHGRPAQPCDLGQHTLLGFDGILSDAPAGRWIREHGESALPAGQSNNLVNHLQAVRAGMGVGALPRIEGDQHPDLELCIPVMAGASQEIWLVMRKDARNNPAVSALADLVIGRVIRMRQAFAGG